MSKMQNPYLMFLGDVADQLGAKTAQGIVDWRPEWCVGQLRLDGCVADLGIKDVSIDEAIEAGAKTLIIGIVNSGGFLPAHWTTKIVEALDKGLDVASGLHIRLGDLPEIKEAADRMVRHYLMSVIPPITLPPEKARRATVSVCSRLAQIALSVKCMRH